MSSFSKAEMNFFALYCEFLRVTRPVDQLESWLSKSILHLLINYCKRIIHTNQSSCMSIRSELTQCARESRQNLNLHSCSQAKANARASSIAHCAHLHATTFHGQGCMLECINCNERLNCYHMRTTITQIDYSER